MHRFNQLEGKATPEDKCLDCGIKRDGSLGVPCVRTKMKPSVDIGNIFKREDEPTREEELRPSIHNPPPNPRIPTTSLPAHPGSEHFNLEIEAGATPLAREVAKMLFQSAQTMLERNKVYGSNYKMVGKLFVDLFPEGLTLKTEDEFNRFHLFMLEIVKLSRYAVNYKSGGHSDSRVDGIVYAAMVEALDRGVKD